jgi:Icc-related predicted phosphoesterase
MYFCTDIHGSERCWKKFLATPKHYECDTIVIGGDITGKFIVPVIETKRGKYKARFAGIERKVNTGPQLDNLLAMIADAGEYAFLTTPTGTRSYAGDQDKTDDLFHTLILKRRAVDRHGRGPPRGDRGRVLISGANDDYFEVDEMLRPLEPDRGPQRHGHRSRRHGFRSYGHGVRQHHAVACPRDVSEGGSRPPHPTR